MSGFGVTVYPDLRPMDEIDQYLKRAASYGCTKVFTSMFSMKGDGEALRRCFAPFIAETHRYGMQVSLDINPECIARMGASAENLEPFHAIGADILRLDISCGLENDLKLLANPYGICFEFNASLPGCDAYLQKLLDRGADPGRIRMCFNFYPQRYTAMKWQKFLEAARALKALGVPVCAFISSHAPHTHGVWAAVDGLPTVEFMRDYPLDLQARLLLATDLVDTVAIGNAYAAEEELAALCPCLQTVEDDPNSKLNQILKAMGAGGKHSAAPQRRLRLTLEPDLAPIEREILFDFFPHTDVGDSSEWIWRSRMPRFVYRDAPIPQRPCAKPMFEVGDVVMVNDTYHHYAGEVQIVLRPIRNDGQRNLLGHLNEQEQAMLPLIREGDTVIFMEQTQERSAL